MVCGEVLEMTSKTDFSQAQLSSFLMKLMENRFYACIYRGWLNKLHWSSPSFDWWVFGSIFEFLGSTRPLSFSYETFVTFPVSFCRNSIYCVSGENRIVGSDRFDGSQDLTIVNLVKLLMKIKCLASGEVSRRLLQVLSDLQGRWPNLRKAQISILWLIWLKDD